MCLIYLPSFAQQFELCPADYYSFEPVFKQSYIVRNHIKTIKAAIVYKRDNEPIEDKGLSKCWEYDSTGLLNRYYATSVHGFVNREVQHPAVYRKGRRISAPYVSYEPVYAYDTTFTTYYYNRQKQIIIRRSRDGDYYNSIYYEYDADGNIKKQSSFRETNASENKSLFRLGVQNMLSTEEFRYEKISATQLRRRHVNDEGKEYKQTLFHFDSLGRLAEENNSFTVSWMRASLKLYYDKNGRIREKVYTSNENGDETSKSEYKYTPDNLVDVEKRYKGDQLFYEYNYIYDRQSKMLTSHFVREDLNKSIVIVRYSYEHY
ncbi:MAG TPA: hypothetical protein VGO45_12515 [Bacteroidia bacterium]|nr:hypothetical protein [Bacteroidia bacterium]